VTFVLFAVNSPNPNLLLCDLCITIAQNLRSLHKFSQSTTLRFGIPPAKSPTSELTFLTSASSRQIFRVSVAALPNCVLCG